MIWARFISEIVGLFAHLSMQDTIASVVLLELYSICLGICIVGFEHDMLVFVFALIQ